MQLRNPASLYSQAKIPCSNLVPRVLSYPSLLSERETTGRRENLGRRLTLFSFCTVLWVVRQVLFTIGSLSNVFERRTSTGSGLFSFFDGGFAQIFSQIASITVKKLRNTNFISSRHVKRENTSLPVDVRRSKTSLLKLPNIQCTSFVVLDYSQGYFLQKSL